MLHEEKVYKLWRVVYEWDESPIDALRKLIISLPDTVVYRTTLDLLRRIISILGHAAVDVVVVLVRI